MINIYDKCFKIRSNLGSSEDNSRFLQTGKDMCVEIKETEILRCAFEYGIESKKKRQYVKHLVLFIQLN